MEGNDLEGRRGDPAAVLLRLPGQGQRCKVSQEAKDDGPVDHDGGERHSAADQLLSGVQAEREENRQHL